MPAKPRFGIARWVLGLATGCWGLALYAAEMSRSVAGVWDSPFGAVTLQHAPATDGPVVVTGWHDEARDHRAELRAGKFDPATGTLEFTFFQPWRNITGTARFQLSADGRQLAGTYSQPGSSGAWKLTRRAATPAPTSTPAPAAAAAAVDADAIAKAANKANTDRKYAEALQLAERALAATPNHETALVEKGKALRDLGRVPEAITWMENALRVHPRSAKLHNSLGLTYKNAKQPEPAITHYTAAIQLDPTDAKPRNNLAIIYLDAGDHDRAIAELREAVKVEPNYGLAHRNLGRAYLAKKMPTEAAAAFERTLQLTPGDATATRGLADARQMQSGKSPAAGPAAPAVDAARLLGALLGGQQPQPGQPAPGTGTAPKKNTTAQALADLIASAVPATPPPAARTTEAPTPAAPQAKTTSTASGDPKPGATTPPSPSGGSGWTGSVALKIGKGKFDANRPVTVRYSASALAPILWVGVFTQGEPADAGPWDALAVYNSQEGILEFRAPAVPGDYEVRVFSGPPPEGRECGPAVPLTVVLPVVAATPSGLPMSPVSDGWEPPSPAVPAPPPPPVVTRKLPKPDTAAMAGAISEFHRGWLAANPPEPRRTLQLEIEQPATAFNLRLTYAGPDRNAPLQLLFPLKLAAARTKEVIGDRPVAIASSAAIAKGLTTYRFHYAASAVDQAAAVMAELIAESGEFGHPAERSGKKKKRSAATAPAAPKAPAAQSGPWPWQTAQWPDYYPLPRHLTGAPAGVREYHSEISFTKKEEKTGLASGVWDPKLLLRFEVSERGDLEVSWAMPRDPNIGSGWAGNLPTLNGRTQLAAVLPKARLLDSKPEGVAAKDPGFSLLPAGTPPEQERLQWQVATARADGPRLEVTIERQQKVVARNTRVETPSPKVAAAAPAEAAPPAASPRPAAKRRYTGKGFPRETVKDARGNTYETYADGTRTKNGYIIDAANPDIPEDPDDPLGLKSAEPAKPVAPPEQKPPPATTSSPKWVRTPVPNAPLEVKERWEFRGEFDRGAKKISGTWTITKAGEKPVTKTVDAHVWLYGTELSGDEKPSAPVWIAQAVPPKGYVRAERPLDLPIKVATAEKPDDKVLRNGKLPYKLVVQDLHTGAEIAKPVSAELPPGETTDHVLRITPPAMNGEWEVRVTLSGAGVEESKDLMMPVGGFPAQIVAARATPSTVLAGQSVAVAVEVRNVLPAALAEAPDARATGSWAAFDPASGAQSSAVLFDLMPGASSMQTVTLPSQESGPPLWPLAVVLWDVDGKPVGRRDLPPVRVTAPVPEGAEVAASLGNTAQNEEAQRMLGDVRWKEAAEAQLKNSQAQLAECRADIQKLEQDIATAQTRFQLTKDPDEAARAERYRKRLAAAQTTRDTAVSEMESGMGRMVAHFERRARELPKNSAERAAYENAAHQMRQQTSLLKIRSIANRSDYDQLEELSKRYQERGDKVSASVALTQLSALAASRPDNNGPRIALHAARKAVEQDPNNANARKLVRTIEADYAKRIHGKLETEMTDAQRRFEAELGNHGEAGFFGATYDFFATGYGTGAEHALSKLFGEQSAIENVAEVVASIESNANAQQAGVVFIRKLVTAGLTMEEIQGLDLRQIYAAQVLAAKKLPAEPSPEQLATLTPDERRRVAAANPEQLKRVFSGLKQLMDSGTPIPDRALAAGYVSIRAALVNPDVKSLMSGEAKLLAVDNAGSTAFKSYLGGESLDLTLVEQLRRGVADLPSVATAITFAPGTTVGGTPLLHHALGKVAQVSPKVAQAIATTMEARQELSFLQKTTLDLTLSLSADYVATKATGDARVGAMTGILVDTFTGLLDVEGCARKAIAGNLESKVIGAIRRETGMALNGLIEGDARFGAKLLNEIEDQLEPGLAGSALETLRRKAAAVNGAVKPGLPPSVTAPFKMHAEVIGQTISLIEKGTPEALSEARKKLAILKQLDATTSDLVDQLRKQTAMLEQLEAGVAKLESNRPTIAQAFSDDLQEFLGREVPPARLAKFSDAEADKFLKDPRALRGLINDGLVPAEIEQKVATLHQQRIKTAREKAFEELCANSPHEAQLFYAVVDTGSWPKGKNFRDADMTFKLDTNPPDAALRKLYGISDKSSPPPEYLLDRWQKDNTTKRRVLLDFEESMGRHLGKLNGHPGPGRDVLKAYDVVINEIPLPRMNPEEYRLKQAFSRASALIGPDAKVATRMSVAEGNRPNLRAGFTVDAIRLPGDAPLKLEPKHALAKVYDEWMMYATHAEGGHSQWDLVQKVGKYPGRVNDELDFLRRAPDSLVPPNAKAALENLQQTFGPLFADWKAIKSQAGEIGYGAAMENVLKGRVDKFRQLHPGASLEQLREMAAAEYLRQCQRYFRAMTSVTKLIPEARVTLGHTDPIGSRFHEFMRQNPALAQQIVFP